MRAIVALTLMALPGSALAQADGGTPLAPAAEAGAPAGIAAGLGSDTLIFVPGMADVFSAAAAAKALDAPVEPIHALFTVSPVADGELAETTGREQVNWLDAVTTNTANVSQNEVGANSVTGDVSVANNAFQNVSGISMVNFNTGNNSSINAGMSVNLQINYASAP